MEEESRAAAFSGGGIKRPASESAVGQAKQKKIKSKKAGHRKGGAVGNSELSEGDESTPLDGELPQAVTDGRRIYLRNLNYNTAKEDIMALFSSENFAVESVDIPTVSSNRRKPRYAFIDLTSQSEAQRAIAEMNGRPILNREVEIGLQTSMRAPPRLAKKKKIKAPQPSSLEEGEIDEEEKGEKGLGFTNSEEIKTTMTQLDEHVHAIWARNPSFSETENYARLGRVLVVSAEWPSKKKQKQKKKITRVSFLNSFYNSIPGQCLVGLYAAQEPTNLNPKEPLRLLLIYGTAQAASSAKGRFHEVKFTMPPDHEIKLNVLGPPALDPRSIVHLAGDRTTPEIVGTVVKWIPTNKTVRNALQSALTDVVLSKAQSGQLALEAYLTQHKVEPNQVVGQASAIDIEDLPPAHLTSQPAHTSQSTEPSKPGLHANTQGVLKEPSTSFPNLTTTRPEQQPQLVQNPTPHTVEALSMDGSASYPYEIDLSPEPMGFPVAPVLPLPDAQHVRSTLAELTQDERILQVRYWGRHRDTDLARCPSCSRDGHMSESCPSRTCRNCDAVDQHFASACPHAQRCNRCGEKGHSVNSCPSKLKLVGEELECDLCSGNGHVGDECPQLWSTYLPDRLPAINKIPRLLVGCYSCGSQLHWGNDCDRGLSDVKIFSDAFSSKEANRYLLDPKQAGVKTGMKIKARAAREVIVIDSDEDEEFEPSAFVHKKADRPQGHGNISMNLSGAQIGRKNNNSQNHSRNNGKPNLPARPDRQPQYHDYPAYPPPQSYNIRTRSRSPDRHPRNDYGAYHARDRNDAPQQRRAFPPRAQSNRHSSGQAQMGRYQPRR